MTWVVIKIKLHQKTKRANSYSIQILNPVTSIKSDNVLQLSTIYGWEMTPTEVATYSGFILECRIQLVPIWLELMSWILLREIRCFIMGWNLVFGHLEVIWKTDRVGFKVDLTLIMIFHHITPKLTKWIHINQNLTIRWVSTINLIMNSIRFLLLTQFLTHILSFKATLDKLRTWRKIIRSSLWKF